jgi:hypothetical protein
MSRRRHVPNPQKKNGHAAPAPGRGFVPTLASPAIKPPSLDELQRLGLKEQDIALGVAMKCSGCGAPATVKITMFAEPKDALAHFPDLCAVVMSRHEGAMPTMETSKGSLFPFNCVGACDLCRKTAEQEAAKAPDWVHVEIYAPKEPTVQSAGGLAPAGSGAAGSGTLQ